MIRPSKYAALPFVCLVVLPWLCVGLLFSLALTGFSCQSPAVTSAGAPVKSEVVVTSAQAIHVAEVALVAVTDVLTASWQAGKISDGTLDEFQTVIAPKVTAALNLARVTLQELEQDRPGSTPDVVLRTVSGLQQQVTELQHFFAAKVVKQ